MDEDLLDGKRNERPRTKSLSLSEEATVLNNCEIGSETPMMAKRLIQTSTELRSTEGRIQ